MSPAERLIAFQCLQCEEFQTDPRLAEKGRADQMRTHLDVKHPYWDLEDLSAIDFEYQKYFREIVANVEEIPRELLVDKVERVSDRKFIFGLIGSIVLFVGVFTPIISLPFVGAVNYFQNGKGDGVIVLVLALVSLVLTLMKKYWALWFTAILSFFLILFSFFSLMFRMSDMKEEMDRDLAGNPFRGIADIAIHSIQLQWGWAVMIIGVGFLFAAVISRPPNSYSD